MQVGRAEMGVVDDAWTALLLRIEGSLNEWLAEAQRWLTRLRTCRILDSVWYRNATSETRANNNYYCGSFSSGTKRQSTW